MIGDMGELGKDERALHRGVGEYAGGLPVDLYVTVGELAKEIAEGIRSVREDAKIREYGTVDAALTELGDLLCVGDTVLVKASHFMHFERIVEELTK